MRLWRCVGSSEALRIIGFALSLPMTARGVWNEGGEDLRREAQSLERVATPAVAGADCLAVELRRRLNTDSG